MIQLDISDDGFLSLMSDDGDTKDDVRMPESEIGDKITKLFKTDEKDTSKSRLELYPPKSMINTRTQTSLFSPPWVRRLPLRPRRLPARVKQVSL